MYCHKLLSRILVISFFSLLLDGQEYNNVSKYLSQSNRTNFCEIARAIENREISLPLALKGMKITIAVAEEIDEANPYIAVRMISEVSRRGQFQYEAYVTGYPDSKINETWTELLYRNTKDHDLAVEWWDRTTQRFNLGMVFQEIWLDTDPILVTRQDPAEDIFIFLNFSKPFSKLLWILLLVTILINAYAYSFLESLQKRSFTWMNVEESMFQSTYSYTGSRSVYNPISRASRILIISMSFLYLILVSTYTANLTNYIVTKSTPPLPIQSVEDAIEKNMRVCAARGYDSTVRLKSTYKNVNVLELLNQREVLMGVSNGKCGVGFIAIAGFKTYQGDPEYNAKCDLAWSGRTVFRAGASFALRDSKELCSSVLDKVVNFHLFEMRKEGKIDEIIEEYRKSRTTNTCGLKSKSSSTKNSSLTTLNVGGAFILHLCLIFVAAVVSYCEYNRKPAEVKTIVKKELTAEVRYNIRRSSITSLPSSVHGVTTEPKATDNIYFERETSKLFENELILETIEKLFELRKEMDEDLQRQSLLDDALKNDIKDCKKALGFLLKKTAS